MDQASGLRKMMRRSLARRPETAAAVEAGPPVKVVCVSSGKGGVGKTNIVAGLAMLMSRMDRRVMVLDADLGLANIDMVLGLRPEFTVEHLLSGEKTLDEVLVDGPWGIRVLPAASGVESMTRLTDVQKMTLLHQMETIEGRVDVLLIDTAAGISDNVIYFNMAAAERIVVATNEPTSITDAYALMKVLHLDHGVKRFSIVINQARSKKEGLSVYRKLAEVADKFLGGVSLDYLGHLYADTKVVQSVRQQRSFVEAFPDSPITRSLTTLAETILNRPPPEDESGSMSFFWRRLMSMSPNG